MPMPVIPDVDLLPADPPNTNDPQNFDPRADAFVAALVLMVVQLNAFIEAMGLAGAFIDQRAADANTYAVQADGRANAAAQALAGALDARDACLAYAQAMGGASGIPPAVANRVFGSDAGGRVDWLDLAAMPAMLAKANRDGAVVTRQCWTKLFHTPAASATLTIDLAAAGAHHITGVAGLTIQFANVPVGAFETEIAVDCLDFVSKAMSWQAGNWEKADGTWADSPGNAGIVWRAGPFPVQMLVVFKSGVPHYMVKR